MNFHSCEWKFIRAHAQVVGSRLDFHSYEWKSIRGGAARDQPIAATSPSSSRSTSASSV